jgi:hypothetical protein
VSDATKGMPFQGRIQWLQPERDPKSLDQRIKGVVRATIGGMNTDLMLMARGPAIAALNRGYGEELQLIREGIGPARAPKPEDRANTNLTGTLDDISYARSPNGQTMFTGTLRTRIGQIETTLRIGAFGEPADRVRVAEAAHWQAARKAEQPLAAAVPGGRRAAMQRPARRRNRDIGF